MAEVNALNGNRRLPPPRDSSARDLLEPRGAGLDQEVAPEVLVAAVVVLVEVGVAVLVPVEEHRVLGRVGGVEAGLAADLHEAVGHLVPEEVPAEVRIERELRDPGGRLDVDGDVQVDPPVAVEVDGLGAARRQLLRPSVREERPAHVHVGGQVGERERPARDELVAEQHAVVGRLVPAAGDEQVEVPVVVEVDERAGPREVAVGEDRTELEPQRPARRRGVQHHERLLAGVAGPHVGVAVAVEVADQRSAPPEEVAEPAGALVAGAQGHVGDRHVDRGAGARVVAEVDGRRLASQGQRREDEGVTQVGSRPTVLPGRPRRHRNW